MLTDEDEDLFKLIENYEALGGECVDLRAAGGDEGGTGIGPPVGETHIPSNLEVDPLSWVSNEITFSPIWEVPAREQDAVDSLGAMDATASSSLSKAVLEVSDRITVESCYDEAAEAMEMSIHFHDVAPGSDGLLPWMALGYRPSELCAMTPPGGGETPIVMVTQASEGAMPEAHMSSLPAEAKGVSQDAFASMYANMKPLEDVEGYFQYSNVLVEAPMVSEAPVVSSSVARLSSPMSAEDTVSLHFKQSVEGPDAMNLMYAIGMSSELGFHGTRGCFQVEPVPCGSIVENGKESVDETAGGRYYYPDLTEDGEVDLGDGGVDRAAIADSSASVASAGIMLALLAIVPIAIGL